MRMTMVGAGYVGLVSGSISISTATTGVRRPSSLIRGNQP